MPEWGSVEGSPDRRRSRGSDSLLQPEDEKLCVRETERDKGVHLTHYLSERRREAPAAKPLEMSVSRGDATDAGGYIRRIE